MQRSSYCALLKKWVKQFDWSDRDLKCTVEFGESPLGMTIFLKLLGVTVYLPIAAVKK